MVDFSKKILKSDKDYPLRTPEKFPKGITGIYKITNKINNKCYIGQSIDIRHRIFTHKLHSDKRKDLRLYKAVNKYGIDNFNVSIICSINIQNRSNVIIGHELNCLECMYIDIFNSYIKGYNSTPGGDSGRLGYKHTKETIEKMKVSASGRTPKVAKDVMKIVYGYDLIDKKYYTSESVSEMSRKTNVNYRSIGQICNRTAGRFIANKRFLFSFTSEDLDNRINFYISGEWQKTKFEKISAIGKKNKGKKYKK